MYLDLFKNITQLLIKFSLSKYSLELFINASLLSDKLYMMGIRNRPECTVCGEGFNSNVHMLLECREIQPFWLLAKYSIMDSATRKYEFAHNKVIIGEPESHHKEINLIIIYGKVCIHLTKMKEICPNFFFPKGYMKRAFDTEKH